MSVTAYKKSMIGIIIAIAVAGLFLSAVSFYFAQEQVLTNQVRRQLQVSLKATGLKVKIGRVRWTGWGRFTGRDLVLTDPMTGQNPLTAERVDISLDPVRLLRNPRRPEVILSKVEFFHLRAKMVRFADGAFDFQQYIPKSKRKLALRTLVNIRGGLLEIDDYQYGTHRLEQVRGKIDLRSLPLIRCSLTGIADLNDGLQWNLVSTYQTEEQSGQAALKIEKALLKKVLPFLPRRYQFSVRSGSADLQFNFAWGNKAVWLRNGGVKLRHSQLVVPKLNDVLTVDYLQGWFDPDRLKLDRARFKYQGGEILASGQLRTTDMALRLKLAANHIRINKIKQFLPSTTNMTLAGTADLQLEVGGKLSHPIVTGDVLLNNTRVVWKEKLDLNRISGQLRIDNNNLTIKRLAGYWEDAPVGATGTINNIFKPQLAIDLYGYGLRPDYSSLGLTQIAKDELKFGKVDVSGRLSGGLRELSFDGEMGFDYLEYRQIRAEQARINLYWETATQAVTIKQVSGLFWGSRVSATGTVKLNSQAAEWRMSGKVSELNLAVLPLSQAVKPSGIISMDILAQGRWQRGEEFDPGTVLGVFHGSSLAYQGVQIDRTDGTFSWNHGILAVDSMEGTVGGGKFFGHLTWSKDGFRTELDAEKVQLRQLLTNRNQFPVDALFEGMITFQGTPDNPIGKITGNFENVIWDSKAIGDVKGEMHYQDQELKFSNLRVATNAGDFLLQGNIALNKDKPTVHGTIISENFQLSRFWQMLPFDPALDIDGNGKVTLMVDGILSNPQFKGRIQLEKPSFNFFTVERGEIRFEGDLNHVYLQQFDLMKQDSRIQISGQVTSKAWNLTVNSNSFALEWLELKYGDRVLRGNVEINGSLTGDLSHPQFTAELNGSDFSFGSYIYQHFLANIVWNSQGLTIKDAQFQQDDSLLNVFGNIDNTQPARLNLGVRVVSSDLKHLLQLVNVQDIDAQGKLSGLVKITGAIDDPLVRVEAELPEGSINQIPIQGGFTLSYTNNKVSIENIHLEHEKGSLIANGIWENGQVLKLNTALRDFPLQVLNPLLQPSARLEGVANADINLEWNNSKITGNYRMNIIGLAMNQTVLGDSRVEGRLSDQGIEIMDGQVINKGGVLTAKGYVPWPVEMLQRLKLPMRLSQDYRDYNVQVELRNFPVDSINFAMKQFTAEKGSVAGSVRVKGALSKPLFYGKIAFSGVKIVAPALPVPVDNMEAALTFQGEKIVVETAHGSYGTGRFSLNGAIEIEKSLFDPELNLSFNGNRIYYRSLYFDGYGALNVNITGTLVRPIIQGEISITNGRIGILGVQPKKSSTNTWNPDLDLVIKAGKNVRYRQYGLADVAVQGELTIKGPLNHPKINGEARSRTGILTVYGQSFKVNKGTAVFKDSEGFTPYIDIDSSLKTSKVEVFLTMKGQVGGEVSFNLSSQPHLSQSELFAILNWSDLSGDKPLTVDGMVSGNFSIVTDTLFGEVFYEIRRALGVDYFYLEQDYRDRKFRINVGDYITEELFLSYSRSVGDEPDDVWGLDYQLTSKLLAGGTYSINEGRSYRIIYRIRF
jgi:autotransporter translocation and assembly factor TamB